MRLKPLSLGLFVFASLLCVQNSYSQATHQLKATPMTVAWGDTDAMATPALRIRPELGGRYPAKRVIL